MQWNFALNWTSWGFQFLQVFRSCSSPVSLEVFSTAAAKNKFCWLCKDSSHLMWLSIFFVHPLFLYFFILEFRKFVAFILFWFIFWSRTSLSFLSILLHFLSFLFLFLTSALHICSFCSFLCPFLISILFTLQFFSTLFVPCSAVLPLSSSSFTYFLVSLTYLFFSLLPYVLLLFNLFPFCCYSSFLEPSM